MDAMIVKDFLTLSKRDYENGAVRNAIYIALKEREELIKQKKLGMTEEWVEEKARELYEMCSYTDRIHGFMYAISITRAKDFICSLLDVV